MGMAASQARLLNLRARISNDEYQGQQINQERTMMANQVSALYNQLLTMDVPTPPAVTDYTTIKYTGSSGTAQYSFDATSVRPSPDGTYTVTLGENDYRDALTKNNGYKTVGASDAGTQIELVPYTGSQTNLLSITDFYVTDGGTKARKATSADFETVTNNGQTTYNLKSGVSYAQTCTTPGTGTNYTIAGSEYTIEGYTAYTMQDALDINLISSGDYYGFAQAIENAGIKNGDGTENLTAQDFYIYVDDDFNAHFARINEVNNYDATTTYNCSTGVSYVKQTKYEDCKLVFDTSTGRITEIDVPEYDKSGNITGYTAISVSAEKVTDEDAYNDAMAQYEYKQHLYDQEMEEINAKTEKIQAEDKNLELKLQRLDTDRTALEQEAESVDKVLKDNIEDSCKTFSG